MYSVVDCLGRCGLFGRPAACLVGRWNPDVTRACIGRGTLATAGTTATRLRCDSGSNRTHSFKERNFTKVCPRPRCFGGLIKGLRLTGSPRPSRIMGATVPRSLTYWIKQIVIWSQSTESFPSFHFGGPRPGYLRRNGSRAHQQRSCEKSSRI